MGIWRSALLEQELKIGKHMLSHAREWAKLCICHPHARCFVLTGETAHSSSELRRSALSRSGDGVGVLRQIDEAPLSASRCRFRARLHVEKMLNPLWCRAYSSALSPPQDRQCGKVYPGSAKGRLTPQAKADLAGRCRHPSLRRVACLVTSCQSVSRPARKTFPQPQSLRTHQRTAGGCSRRRSSLYVGLVRRYRSS